MKKNKIVLTVAASAAMAVSASFASADCGDVTIADMNWASASLLANIDALILAEGYGCDVSIVPGDTIPTGTSMIEKGEPDIAPEFWINNFKDQLEAAEAEGRLLMSPSLTDGGEEGWWVPQYMVDENPALATLEGIKANPGIFTHPEDPDLGMVMGCPAGWGCQITTGNLFKAFDMEGAGFDLVDPGSAAGLDGAIARAYERQEPWLGYYWAPTSLLGKYKMVKVDFGVEHDADEFVSCTVNAECLEPKPNSFPVAPVRTVVTGDFLSGSPEAASYVTSRQITNDVLNEALAWGADNQADGEFAAYHFLETYEELWTQWVSDDVADKIRDAL